MLFDEAVRAGHGSIILSNDTDIRTISITDSQVAILGNKITVNPIAALNVGNYSVKLDAGTVQDLAGNSLLGSAKNVSFAFETDASSLLNTQAPKLTNMLSSLSNLKLIFNTPIQAIEGDIVISHGSDIRTISIADKSQISILSNVITVNLKDALNTNKNYTVQVVAGVIADKVGNAFIGSTATTPLSFKIISDIPVVLAGKAIHGYLKNADVFADENGNGIWNTDEAKATTNATGNFFLINGSGAIIVSGGVDLTTGYAFKGTLTAPEGSAVVTPLTTLQQGFISTGLTPIQAQQVVATAFGFDSSKMNLQTYDPFTELLNTTIANQTFATQMMANAAQIENFLVTAAQVLQGAAGHTLTMQFASQALVNALVSTIKNDAKTGDGKIDLANTTLLKTVLIESAKDVAKNSIGESVSFEAKINKMADSVAAIMKDAADNITAAVNTGENPAVLLSNMGKVTAFTQGNVGDSLKIIATNWDVATVSAKLLDDAVKNFTGVTADNTLKTIQVVDLTVVATQAAANASAQAAANAAAQAAANAAAQAAANAVAQAAANAATQAAANAATQAAANVAVQAAANAATQAAANAAAQAAANAAAQAATNAAAQAATNAAAQAAAPPTLSSSTPIDNATAVAIESNIVLSFNKAVKIGNGDILISNPNDHDYRTISVTDTSQISISGNVVTINPSNNFEKGYDYNVTFVAGVIQDLAGHDFAGITNATTLNFTTVPVVLNTVNFQTSGNDLINCNQGTVFSPAIIFTAEGNDQYVIATIPVGDSIISANILINGFGAGDTLVFDVATPTLTTPALFVQVDALYPVSDDGSEISLVANYGGSVQNVSITLTGISGSRACVDGSIDSVTELNTFLMYFNAGSINFV